MATPERNEKTQLVYTILCDDVRLEVGNKLSLMGIFQNIIVPKLPVWLSKFAVVNHWRGEGTHLSQVIILTPDKQQEVVKSQPTAFEIASGGFADNISFFVNVTFPVAGHYWVQMLVDSNLYSEQTLLVAEAQMGSETDNGSETVH